MFVPGDGVIPYTEEVLEYGDKERLGGRVERRLEQQLEDLHRLREKRVKEPTYFRCYSDSAHLDILLKFRVINDNFKRSKFY